MNNELGTVYCGDGVYASFDGYQVWLHVLRNGKQETIAMDQTVLDAVLRFARTKGFRTDPQ